MTNDGYYRSDARRLANDIRKAIPDATVETWRDFGFAVDVRLGHKVCVACQPLREDIGQAEVFRTVDEVKHILEVQGDAGADDGDGLP